MLVCYPALKYTGYSITPSKALVMVWAGLRGAVGLALSLFLLFDGQIADSSYRLLAFFFLGVIAAITIMVQGTTTGMLLQVNISKSGIQSPIHSFGQIFLPSFDFLFVLSLVRSCAHCFILTLIRSQTHCIWRWSGAQYSLLCLAVMGGFRMIRAHDLFLACLLPACHAAMEHAAVDSKDGLDATDSPELPPHCTHSHL